MTACSKFASLLLLALASATNIFAQAGGGPTYVISFILGTSGNQVQIGDQGLLTFPRTPVNTISSATIVIQNRAAKANGAVKNVVTFGSTFSTSGLPLFPITLNAGATGSETRFTLNFAPLARAAVTGNLQIEFDTGFVTIALSGQGIGPSLVVEQVGASGDVIPVVPNGTMLFPDTLLGQNVTTTVRIRNEGEVAATVNGITVTGASYTILNGVPLPVSIAPQNTVLFNIRFAPTTVGTITGRLLIDGTIINLSAKSLGANFDFVFTVSGVSTPATNGATLLLPNTVVGGKVTGQLVGTNTGNTPGTVTSISLNGTGLSVLQIPLPTTIAPGDKFTVSVVFAPVSATTSVGSLAIDNLSFIVRGTGSAPQAIPNFTFGGVGDTSTALQQPVVSLKLASPYPVDLSGKLTISFLSNSFVDDPSIQFAPGGRVVSFTIPANTTDAIFGQASQVQFQTGSVAGTISITPSFSVGAADLTPPQPLVKTVAIPPAAPQLQKIAFGTRTLNSLELLVTGYATSRSVSGLNLNFTAANGKTLQGNALTIDVGPAFNAWYQAVASGTVGSQFTASVTINVNGDMTAVQSVSVTATNANGTSGAVSANFQ